MNGMVPACEQPMLVMPTYPDIIKYSIFLQAQYQLIFEALLVFLDSFSTYANF